MRAGRLQQWGLGFRNGERHLGRGHSRAVRESAARDCARWGQQRAAGASGRIQLEGQVVGIEPGGGVRHERAERVMVDEAVQFFEPRFREVLGQVHALIR